MLFVLKITSELEAKLDVDKAIRPVVLFLLYRVAAHL